MSPSENEKDSYNLNIMEYRMIVKKKLAISEG